MDEERKYVRRPGEPFFEKDIFLRAAKLRAHEDGVTLPADPDIRALLGPVVELLEEAYDLLFDALGVLADDPDTYGSPLQGRIEDWFGRIPGPEADAATFKEMIDTWGHVESSDYEEPEG